MAGTLTITLRTPDAKAMRRYRYLWLVERDGSTLGWGHTHRRDDAETEAWDLVEARARYGEQAALGADAELGVCGGNHVHPSVSTQRPKAFCKKFFSTVSWPILACSSLISASWVPALS